MSKPAEEQAIAEHIQSLSTAFIILDRKDSRVVGTLDLQALLAWSSIENAEGFAKGQYEDCEIREVPMEEMIARARKLGFQNIRFDQTNKDESGRRFFHLQLK